MAKKRFQNDEEMTGFVTFKESFERQTRFFKISNIIGISCFSITIAILTASHGFHILERVDSFRNELSKEKICLIGMNSIIKNRPNLDLIDGRFIKKMSENKVHYSIKPKDYYRPYMVNKNRCKLTVIVEGGLVGFDVKIAENGEDYNLVYAIIDFDEYPISGVKL